MKLGVMNPVLNSYTLEEALRVPARSRRTIARNRSGRLSG